RQLGITQSQTGVVAPSLRQSGRLMVERTDQVRSFIAIANPNADDVAVDFSTTDEDGTSTDPVTVTVPAGGQYSTFFTDQPISFAVNTNRTVSFTATLPVFVTALRFFTNERNDSLLSVIPIADVTVPIDQRVVIPHFADGAGWKTRVSLVNNTDEELRGEIHFVGQGSLTGPPQAVIVGSDAGDSSVYEYHLQPRSFYQLQTNGLMENLATGSVQIIPFLGYHTPSAQAVVANFVVDAAATAAAGETRTNTIFETSVEGQLPSQSLRFYAEAVGDFDNSKPKSTRTSVAIANPAGAPATV